MTEEKIQALQELKDDVYKKMREALRELKHVDTTYNDTYNRGYADGISEINTLIYDKICELEEGMDGTGIYTGISDHMSRAEYFAEIGGPEGEDPEDE